MHGPRRTIYYTDGQQVSLEELEVIRRFSSGRYALSVVGLLKIFTAVVFFVAAALHFGANKCPGAPDWYDYLSPAIHLVVGASVITVYVLFTLGFAEGAVDAWVKADLVLLLVETALIIAASITSLVVCDQKEMMHIVSGVVGLVGALLLLVTAAGTYVLWRYREEEGASVGRDQTAAGGPTAGGMPGDRPPPRKSIFA